MKQLQKKITDFKAVCMQAIDGANTLEALEAVRVQFLGRNGTLADLMSTLKDLDVEQKRFFGPALNSLKREVEEQFQVKKEALLEELFARQEQTSKDFDVTSYLPGKLRGSLHPLTLAAQDIENIFISMGYRVADGFEAESEYYNFEALNIPKNHPARDMQDTFFLTIPQMVMRTHTSSVQIRAMETMKPPFAIVATGRTYRNEATDASHDFMFRQFEGLVVGEKISLGHLLGTMKLFLRTFFDNDDIKIRARPGYFPFVEPGLEIDMSCLFCKNGCSTCKQSSWIEVVGSGLVHPRVLEHGKIDPTKFSGFAFGFGLTRLVMLKYGINDIRLLHNAHVDFLKQF